MRDFLDPYGFKMPEILGSGDIRNTFSAEYLTVYDAFGIKPADDIATQQDTMVRALVAAGIWALLDVFYIFANNTRGNAVINWINPGTYDAIEVNAPTFTAYRGFQGNGVNQYLDSQFNPTTAAGNYIQNSACAGIYSRTAGIQNRTEIGVNDTVVVTQLRANYIANNVGGTINTGAVFNGGVLAGSVGQGLYIIDRSVAANWDVYWNGNPGINVVSASTGIPNLNFWLCCLNNAGAPLLLSTRELSMGIIGGSLSIAEHLSLFNALETYLDYVGAGVV